MRTVGKGVVLLDAYKGYLDLTQDTLDKLISREPIADHYQVEHTPFARGKFAAVRRARCLRSGTWYAAKVMRKRRRAQDVRHEILHEAAVLLLARPSSRIVSLHQLYETTTEIILVLELAEGGELQRIIDEEESLGEEAVRKYMANILGALRFLHSHNIAHLDIKPQNLLLMGQHPGSEVKLCDFGISRIILSDIEVREVLGTPDYVAPEILQYEPISLATDMWSVGVLTYVLLTGHSPFGGDTKQETFLNISQGQVDFPKDLFCGVSDKAIDFITQLLMVDPRCRLTVEEALQHQWLNGVQSPARPLPTTPGQASPASPTSPAGPPPNPTPQCCSQETQQPPIRPSNAATSPCTSCGGPSSKERTPHASSQVTLPSPDVVPQTSWAATPPRLPRETKVPPPGTHKEGESPWRRSVALNKENNKNSLNKTEEASPSPSPDSPSKGRTWPPYTERAKREAEPAKKLAIGKENKEHGTKEPKESAGPKEKLRPSPLCLRRQGSKCELKSPSEQHKYSPVQGSVSIILEKSIIC